MYVRVFVFLLIVCKLFICCALDPQEFPNIILKNLNFEDFEFMERK